MVWLERWTGCLLLLLMYLAVHQCIFVQPHIEVKDVAIDLKNRSSSLSQKQICDNITQLLAGPKNQSTEIVPLCAQNVTSPPALNSTTNSTDDCKMILDAPCVFPQEESNRTKVMTTSTIQNTLHLNNVTNSSNLDPAKVEPANANINETVYLNKTEVKPNITNISATNDNLNVNITDVKSNSSMYKTHIQNKTDVPVDITSTTNVSKEANIKKTNSPVVAPVQANVTASNSSKIDTEVPDLLNSSVNCLSPNQIPESSPNVTFNATQQIDRDTELIEDGQNTEDILRNSSSYEDKLSGGGVPLIQGQLAAILAGVFVIISVTAYVGLLSWRRYLENRYGNRQMLVNEDEFNDDLRHFSI